jgi:hypothetical protein
MGPHALFLVTYLCSAMAAAPSGPEPHELLEAPPGPEIVLSEPSPRDAAYELGLAPPDGSADTRDGDLAPTAPCPSDVTSSRRWQRGRTLLRTSWVGLVAGPPVMAFGAVLSWGGPEFIGMPLYLAGGAMMVYGAVAMPVGLYQQNLALREAGFASRPTFLTVSAVGVGVMPFGIVVPSLAALGGVAAISGLVLQHVENRRVLKGKKSMWRASLSPYYDGQHHGLRLAASF